MNNFYLKLKENFGLTLILAIGLGVEFSNFQAMFFRFMSQYRADWGAFNHIPAVCLSAFLLLCIVIFGIRKQNVLSWFLAMLTCVISFSVYSRMNLSWDWANMSEVHFVILILSGMLPMLVAYTTHQIAKTDSEFYDDEQEKLEGFIREIRRLQYQKQQNQTENHAKNNDTHGHSKNTFVEEPVATYKQKVSYDKSPSIKPEKAKNEVPEIPLCEECGTEMQGKRKGTKYCSKSCSLTAQKRRKNQENGVDFTQVSIRKTINGTDNLKRQQSYQNPNYQYNSQEFDNFNSKLHHYTANNIENEFENSFDNSFDNSVNLGDVYTFESKPANSKHTVTQTTVKGSVTQSSLKNNAKDSVKDNLENENIDDLSFSCENCGKETKKRSHHSKYCSEVCRISALKTKRKSDFFVRNDSFDTNGSIEWANPQHKN